MKCDAFLTYYSLIVQRFARMGALMHDDLVKIMHKIFFASSLR